MLVALNVHAQSDIDTADKITIHILHSEFITGIKTDSGTFQKSNGNVIMQQGTDTLYCDSLIRNLTTNVAECFGHVKIAQQDGTQATSDFLRYTTSKKLAYMEGNVHLTDGKNNLECEQLTYDLGTKVGVFDHWGTLKNDSTTITSRTGVYNVKSKDARFTGDALITDPQYVTNSADIGYNTETKISQFYSRSVVRGDSGRMVLHTTKGFYNSVIGEAYFTEHSNVQDDNMFIEGDTLYYNKLTGYGNGYGHVIAIDTSRHSKMYCGKVIYRGKQRKLWAMIKPVLEQVNGKDTLWVRADSFYSAPIIRQKLSVYDSLSRLKDPKTGKKLFSPDSLAKYKDTTAVVNRYVPPPAEANPANFKQPDISMGSDTTADKAGRRSKKKNRKEPVAKAIAIDTAVADSTAPLMFIGYHHVKIFSDSLQGVCDSISYTQTDSTIRMIYNPIAWSRASQITGDTINLLLDSSRLKSLYVPNNAFVVSRSGPVKAGLYDQIQGKVLRAYMKNNTINRMIVYPNAEAIYYTKDDHGAYIGVSQAKSDSLLIFFEDQKIKNIKFVTDVHQTLTPMDKADLPGSKLSRFKWLDIRRPRSKEELFQ